MSAAATTGGGSGASDPGATGDTARTRRMVDARAQPSTRERDEDPPEIFRWTWPS